MGFSLGKEVVIAECEEHKEPTDFKKSFGCGSQEQLDFPRLYRSFKENLVTLRLFNLTNLSGEFTAVEISPPTYNHQLYVPFPYLQKDLYDASQPGVIHLFRLQFIFSLFPSYFSSVPVRWWQCHLVVDWLAAS